MREEKPCDINNMMPQILRVQQHRGIHIFFARKQKKMELLGFLERWKDTHQKAFRYEVCRQFLLQEI
jgi:hypothetical protein